MSGTISVGIIKSKTAGEAPAVQDSAGDEIGHFCRAWVTFDGSGSLTIKDSFNVASISDNQTGDWTVVFIHPMGGADYCVAGTAGLNSSQLSLGNSIKTASSARVTCRNYATTNLADATSVDIAVFANG